MAIVKELREVQDFEEVAMEGHGDLIIVQGDAETLEIEADEELLPKLKTEVRGRRLVLGYRNWWDWLTPPWGGPPIHYTVTMKTVRGVVISGSGTVTAGEIRTDDLRLEMSGSGRGTIDRLDAETLGMRVSGSGRLEVGGGQVREQEITISGSGSLHAEELISEEADVRISGSGNIRLHAEKTLNVHISGSGEVDIAASRWSPSGFPAADRSPRWKRSMGEAAERTLSPLDRPTDFTMCGQWVEPGGMAPVCAMSGRNAIWLLCHADRQQFVTALP